MKLRRSLIATTLSTALIASLVSGCGGESTESLIASSKEFLAKNDNKAAVIQLKNALQKEPNLGEARFLLGKALLESGDAPGAEVELRKALALKYSVDQTIPLLTKALLATGQAKKLIDEFAKAQLGSGEPMASLQTTLSSAYAVQGNREAAEKSLAAALSAQPDYAPAQLADARNKASKGKLDEAQAVIDSVLAKNPKHPEALLLNGTLLAVKGNTDAALGIYRKAVEAKPDYLVAHSAVISTLLQQQKFDEAGKEIDALKKIAPKHPQTIYLDAQASYQRKDFKATRALTQQLLRLAPNNPNALQLAGAAEYQLQSYLQAEAYFGKALQQAPDLLIARRLLVATYLRTGQPAKALSTLQPVFGKIDNDPAMLSLAGESYLQNGDAIKATEYFTKASKLDPENATRKTSIALSQIAQGNTALGFDELEKISSSDKGSSADLALIAVYLRANQPDKALEAIDHLEKKQEASASTHNLRARTLLSKKDIRGARQSFEKALSLNPAFMPAAAGLATLDLAEKKPDDARKRFESVLLADPKNMQALLALAEIRIANGGTTDEVAALIGKAVTANPTEAAPRLALIQFYLGSKDTKRALSAANDAAASMPDKPEILDALGRTQQISGDLNQALTSYGKLAALQPASPLANLRIAEIQLLNKNKDEASKSLKKALEIKADLVEAQRGLILLAMDAKKPDEALGLARQIQKQRPKEAIGYILEGDIFASDKNWPSAINLYRTGLKQAASPELAIKLHAALLASGNTPEADKTASAWIKDHPKDIALRMHLGDLATSRKDYAQASQLYRAALEIQPNNPLTLNNLAWVSGQLKAPKAVEYAEKANQIAPNQPAFMDTLAMLLADKGDTSQAIDLLRKALTKAPEASAIRLNLAKVLIMAGNKNEARKELDALAALGDKFQDQATVARLQKEL